MPRYWVSYSTIKITTGTPSIIKLSKNDYHIMYEGKVGRRFRRGEAL